jgi:hypothetical protein
MVYVLKVTVEIHLNKNEDTYSTGPAINIDPCQMQVFAAR